MSGPAPRPDRARNTAAAPAARRQGRCRTAALLLTALLLAACPQEHSGPRPDHGGRAPDLRGPDRALPAADRGGADAAADGPADLAAPDLPTAACDAQLEGPSPPSSDGPGVCGLPTCGTSSCGNCWCSWICRGAAGMTAYDVVCAPGSSAAYCACYEAGKQIGACYKSAATLGAACRKPCCDFPF